MTIIAHCGGEVVERPQLALVDTPSANLDTGWTPIAHDLLLEHVLTSMQSVGYVVTDEQHVLNKNGMQYFGLITVKYNNEYQLLIGLRNAHDKSFAAWLLCGSHVFLCDNLGFSAEIKMSRKHTRHIMRDLQGMTMRAVGKLGDMSKHQDQRFTAYKQHELTDSQADHLVVQMLRNQIIVARQIPHIIDEWDNPSHPEFAADGRTAWRLFNAVTEASKGRLQALPRATMGLHGMLDSVCEAEFREVA